MAGMSMESRMACVTERWRTLTKKASKSYLRAIR
jgi:hypothetical protein